jgi:hypothetical protein
MKNLIAILAILSTSFGQIIIVGLILALFLPIGFAAIIGKILGIVLSIGLIVMFVNFVVCIIGLMK